MIRDCTICLVPHEETLHQASLNVRAYLKQRVTFSEPLPVEDKPLRQPIKERAEQSPVRLNMVEKIGIPKKIPKRSGRYSTMTTRQMLDALKSGETLAAISNRAGIQVSAVAQRILRSKDQAIKAEYAALLVCSCKKPKHPSNKVCYQCTREAQRENEKA